MAESKAFQSVVIQVATQAAMAVVMLMRESVVGPVPGTNTASSRKAFKDMVDPH